MEGKVTLIDANGVQIGETYTRRARQLVKQQRAIWADDTHTAIQFMPDSAEEWETPITPEPEPVHTPPPASTVDTTLYAMAEKSIYDRRRLILHTVAVIPGYIAIAILWAIIISGRWFEMSYLTMGIAWGMWTMAYISHLRNYKKAYRYLSAGDYTARRRMQLQAEVDRLKRLGYTE